MVEAWEKVGLQDDDRFLAHISRCTVIGNGPHSRAIFYRKEPDEDSTHNLTPAQQHIADQLRQIYGLVGNLDTQTNEDTGNVKVTSRAPKAQVHRYEGRAKQPEEEAAGKSPY
jgi:hypothetical protein